MSDGGSGTAPETRDSPASGCCGTDSADPDTSPTQSCCEADTDSDDSCCATPARRDWFLWACVALVAASLILGQVLTGQDHGNPAVAFAHAVSDLLARMWWGLALGVLFVGLLAQVPRDLVISVLGREAGLGGMFRATLAGVFLDLCSHGILAVGMKLYERGASTGQVMAFLLASPWNSLSLTLILFGLIGVGWTLLFILLSLLIGIITGLVFDALTKRQVLPANPWREEIAIDLSLGEQWREYRQGWNFSLAGAMGLLGEGLRGSRVVIRWALFGLLLASAIRALVPVENYAAWFGASVAGLWLTLLAATVIEVCSEGATPIAADLMNRAAAPGNSFTFLMAGVATDYTEIMSIRDTARSWSVALCLPLVTVPQVMLIAYLLNRLG